MNWHISTLRCYTTLKKNKLLLHVISFWISQTQKNIAQKKMNTNTSVLIPLGEVQNQGRVVYNNRSQNNGDF